MAKHHFLGHHILYSKRTISISHSRFTY